MIEKRKVSRIVKRLEVRFHTTVENTAITNDLSEKGLFIRTNREIVTGSVLNLTLDLPNSEELFLKGKVIRSVKHVPASVDEEKIGFGIQLLDPSPDYKDYVQTILG